MSMPLQVCVSECNAAEAEKRTMLHFESEEQIEESARIVHANMHSVGT